jgi:hypothetical protein
VGVWRGLWSVIYACVFREMYSTWFVYWRGLFYGGSGGNGWWFSILLLVRIICIRNLIALWYMFFIVFLVVEVLILRKLCLSCVLVGWCMAPRAPAVMTISRAVFHPLCAISSIRVLYFSYFSRILSGGNQSLQYVNSTNWIVTVGVGACRGS